MSFYPSPNDVVFLSSRTLYLMFLRSTTATTATSPPPPQRRYRLSLLSAHLPDLGLSVLSLSLPVDLTPTAAVCNRRQPPSPTTHHQPLLISLSLIGGNRKSTIVRPPASQPRSRSAATDAAAYTVSSVRSPTVLAATVCLDLGLSLSADSSHFSRSHTHTNTTTAPVSACWLPLRILQTQPPPHSAVFTSVSPRFCSLSSPSAFDRTHMNTITATSHREFPPFSAASHSRPWLLVLGRSTATANCHLLPPRAARSRRTQPPPSRSAADQAASHLYLRLFHVFSLYLSQIKCKTTSFYTSKNDIIFTCRKSCTCRIFRLPCQRHFFRGTRVCKIRRRLKSDNFET